MNDKKLKEGCAVLRKIIIKISEIYHNNDTNDDQKRLIETVIGAAIFYLPSGKELHTGKISEEAKKLKKQENSYKGLTREHEYPRKYAGRQFLTKELEKIKKSENYLVDLYRNKYGRWNWVTKKENQELRKPQKNFVSPKNSYSKAKIKLVKE